MHQEIEREKQIFQINEAQNTREGNRCFIYEFLIASERLRMIIMLRNANETFSRYKNNMDPYVSATMRCG